jgi:hypothetical protein
LEIFWLWVDDSHSRNVLCALSYISKFLLCLHIGLHTFHQFGKMKSWMKT